MTDTGVNAVPLGDDDDVVLTGLSGLLPESDSIEEFAQQLFDGVDLVTADDRRWTPGLHGLPKHSGKLKDLSRFDASFFGVNPKQAHLLDPQLRLLLELTHEVLVDAGYNPAELRGSRTGVYVGVSNSESIDKWTEDPDKISGYAVVGCSHAMFANRLSFTFDFKGPSYSVDTACSSSLTALAQAAEAIAAGHCDTAVVAGTNLCLKPANSLNYHRLGMLSSEGRCAVFDASATGYVRSEAVVAVLLQKRSAARRLYATLRGARVNNEGYKEEGITFPSREMKRRLAEETFTAARLRPSDVVYIETHGTGTKVGDPHEVNAIADLFCLGRKSSLLLGSVKSNMGHSEAASGLCAIAKVLVAMERGVIPQNLHYKSPNPDIPALSDGRIKVVDSNTLWDGGLVAINGFGFGGANAHIILESHDASPTRTVYRAPRLVLVSGRHEQAVRALLALAAQHRDNADLHALLDSVHRHNVVGHPYRGFTVLTEPPVVESTKFDSGDPHPIWFVFSGMGSQWPGMARDLMRLPVFAASISRSADVLQSYGLDLLEIVTEAHDTRFEDIITSIVAITAMQIALVDVLRALEIRPDGIVGYSVGEIGCAYADNTLTAEQAVLVAYWRGRSIMEATLEPGAIAAVRLSRAQCEARYPCEELPSYFESESERYFETVENITVSGSNNNLNEFVVELGTDDDYTCYMKGANSVFHSKYIMGRLMRENLERIIADPKPRSTRWISSSVSRDMWNSNCAKLSDANYFTNNLLSPVLFTEALQSVPERALLVEVAPHALLQTVLRRSPPAPHVTYVAMGRRDVPDTLVHLLSAVGSMHAAGVQPAVSRLYPTVTFPVARGTPGLASHVLWDHSQKWNVAHFGAARLEKNVIEFDLSRSSDDFIADHIIDGRILFPGSGYLTLVWRTMAKLYNRKPENTPIILENVRFHRATIVSHDTPVRFLINVLSGTGEFDVCEGGTVVATGLVRLADDAYTERLRLLNDAPPRTESNLRSLNPDDIYKELRLRGYGYDGVFRGIRSSDVRGSIGELAWNDNWITFMDTMLQFSLIGINTCELYINTYLQRVLIDPQAQLAALAALGENQYLPVRMYRNINALMAGGVELRGISLTQIQRRINTQAAPTLEKYVFAPYHNTIMAKENLLPSKSDVLRVNLQLVLENIDPSNKLKILEAALDKSPEALLMPLAMQILEIETVLCIDASIATEPTLVSYATIIEDLDVKIMGIDVRTAAFEMGYHVVMAADVLSHHGAATLVRLASALEVGGMLLLEEPLKTLDELKTQEALTAAGLTLVSRQLTINREFVLLRLLTRVPERHVVVDITDDTEYSWVDKLRKAMALAEREKLRLYLVTRTELNGALGLAKCLRTEPGGHALRLYYLPNAREPFTPSALAYAKQVDKDLVVNVLRADVWGSYRHIVLDDIGGKQMPMEHACVNILMPGDLTTLRWVEAPLRCGRDCPLPLNTELCSVYSAAVNFHDILLATGKLPRNSLPGYAAEQECTLGMEFSGYSSTGVRVMGVVSAQGLASTVLADKDWLWKVPNTWTLEEAATVPVAYSTAYYALVVRGRMRRGESVLVHAGSGGVGLAAIRIALAADCAVYTTAGTLEKRAFLCEHFPALSPDRIGNSRDCSFEQLVLNHTDGRGVDLVLNSLADDKLLASVRCLAEGGRFLEISKIDLSNNKFLGMSIFLKNITFHGVMLDALFKMGNNHGEKMEVVRCVTEGIVRGTIRPLPVTTFSANQIESAFRYMATGRHVGKVVLRVREEEAGGARPGAKLVSAAPRTYMHPARSYVLVGGLGGVGLELAKWMVTRGATKIMFNSRNGVRTGYQAWCIRRWREAGMQVRVSTADASSPEGVRALLREATAMAPIGGVFNLAVWLRDALLNKLNPADFEAVARPKINVTKALDAATRELAPELEHFVVFSSVSCGRGNPGQSNYGLARLVLGLANSAMERICERRQADGLPGLAIQWGAIADVGLFADMVDGHDIVICGTVPQRVASCMEALCALLALPHAVVGCKVVVNKRQPRTEPTHELLNSVANILGIKDPSKVSDTASLTELGMDSLMGTEIKQTLEGRHGLVLGVADVRALTFAKLRRMATGGERADNTHPAL